MELCTIKVLIQLSPIHPMMSSSQKNPINKQQAEFSKTFSESELEKGNGVTTLFDGVDLQMEENATVKDDNQLTFLHLKIWVNQENVEQTAENKREKSFSKKDLAMKYGITTVFNGLGFHIEE